MKKILISFASFLILNSCTHVSVKPQCRFDGKWEFMQKHPFDEPKACLPEDDVKKLREILIECGKSQ